jgi:hypothetical protein
MPVYYVEIDHGCGLRVAKNRDRAWSDLLKAEGYNHAVGVRLASIEDIEQVKSMGGYVPEEALNKLKKGRQTN